MSPFRPALALMLAFAATLQAQTTPAPNKVDGLELDAPKQVTQPGYLKVTAAVTEGDVCFDVEAQFADPDIVFQYEPLGPKTVLIGIPDSPGVIRVSCWRVPGKVGDKLAKTYIEVKPAKKPPTPAPTPAPKPEPGPQPPQAEAPARVDAFIVLDYKAGDPKAAQLANGRTLREAVHAQKAKLHILSATSEVLAQQGIAKDFQEAGGAPALIVVADGKIAWKGKLPATEAEILTQIPKVK